MLFFNIKRVFKLRGITKPYPWLIKAGFPGSIARKLQQEDYANLPLAHLEKLCLLLRCTPHDLLRWEPEAGMETDTHPLSVLLDSSKAKNLDWITEMGSKSIEELRALGRKIDAVKAQEEDL